MIWISIIALVLSTIGICVSIWAVKEAKKSNEAVLRQNLEQELAQIEADIKEIDAQQADAEARGAAEIKNIYSVNVPNPYGGVVVMLELKKRNLQDRRAKIKKRLKQLKGEIGPACNAGE